MQYIFRSAFNIGTEISTLLKGKELKCISKNKLQIHSCNVNSEITINQKKKL